MSQPPRYTLNPVYKGAGLTESFKAVIGDPNWLPTHYIVSLVHRADRRSKMIRKMEYSGLAYKLVDAYTPTDEIIRTHYGFRCPLQKRWGCNGSTLGPVIACMVSHFKALREFLASADDIAVVFEDDVILRFDYRERIRQLIDKYKDAPTFPNLIMLSPGIDPNRDELFANTTSTWGALGYMITRTYAQHILNTYDRRYIDVSMIIRRDGIACILNKHGASSELIPMKSGGLVCSIPLVIEQPNEVSNLGNSISFHTNMFKKFGYENYITNY